MPTATQKTIRKFRRMTDRHILRRIALGTLLVDVFEAEVYVRRHAGEEWRQLTVYRTPRTRRPVVRLYYRGRRVGIMRNRLVWIAAHERPIPRGHEIHHKDRDRENDCWSNLVCKSRQEHLAEHYGEF